MYGVGFRVYGLSFQKFIRLKVKGLTFRVEA